MNEILIIEDTEADAQLLELVIRQTGIASAIKWLPSGKEALAYLDERVRTSSTGLPVPSVIFVDLKMPGLNGFQVLEEIRAEPALANALLIVISSLDDMHSIKSAYAAGAKTFLAKPINRSDLRELIDTFPGYWSFSGRDGSAPAGSFPFLVV